MVLCQLESHLALAAVLQIGAAFQNPPNVAHARQFVAGRDRTGIVKTPVAVLRTQCRTSIKVR